ncbi:heterochromatin protein 1 [Plasmodium brasilianum]|uniref:Heterochromatin protein 1, putative n=2 Tax=Plasmodium (Plasmodium) TaxID=418103 RepID=A0A1A8WJK7_PLAMA|nr:heterochromatin protein 1, putative [Plasmodium malariae]KAI4834924.1 heterochromatin protein 1 [Plasmodium brasilianum]SBS93118.1 heterochromatin protein 1, putative [Plasmodium malariae]SBT80888.1 heterochromatin protein 1, putative [Plasmodium malariae]SCP03493.1 heterochromatin protein 1, putative [Plasmodium malariae]
MTGSDEEFEIGDILEIKRKKNGFIYLVKWKGYSDDENTWEPESNLVHLTSFKKKMEYLKSSYLNKNDTTINDSKNMKNHLLSPSMQEEGSSGAKSKGRNSLISKKKNYKKSVANKMENKKNLSPHSDNSFKRSDEEDNESIKQETITINYDNALLNVEDVYSVRIKNRKMEFLASLKNASPQWVEESNIRRTGHLNIKVNDFKKYIRRKKTSKGNRIVIKNLHNVGDELYISVIHNINNKEIHSLYPSKVIEYIYPQELLNFLLSRLRYRTA